MVGGAGGCLLLSLVGALLIRRKRKHKHDNNNSFPLQENIATSQRLTEIKSDEIVIKEKLGGGNFGELSKDHCLLT